MKSCLNLTHTTSKPNLPRTHSNMSITTLVPLLWIALLALLSRTTTAFPTHFPPSTFTNSIPIPVAHVAIFNNPGTDSVTWTGVEASPPPVLLCTGPDLTGSCTLFENNAAETCLTLPSTLAVGSVKVIGKAACVVYE
jgi:hypothetical protein